MSNETLSTQLAVLKTNQTNMEKKLDDFIDVRFTKFEEKLEQTFEKQNTRHDVIHGLCIH